MLTLSEEIYKYIRVKLEKLEEKLEEERVIYELPDAISFNSFLYDDEGNSIFEGESNVDDVSSSSYSAGYYDGQLKILRDLFKLLPKE